MPIFRQFCLGNRLKIKDKLNVNVLPSKRYLTEKKRTKN